METELFIIAPSPRPPTVLERVKAKYGIQTSHNPNATDDQYEWAARTPARIMREADTEEDAVYALCDDLGFDLSLKAILP